MSCGFQQIEPWPHPHPRHPGEDQANHVNYHRQMKSVTTGLQGRTYILKWHRDTPADRQILKHAGRASALTFTLSNFINTCSFFYTGWSTDVHIHTLLQSSVPTLHALKQIDHSHVLCQAPVSQCCIPRETRHPHIQGPCLSTLVIMVNSWACYLKAAP